MRQISDPAPSARIEVVRGRLDAGRSEELLAFWADHGFSGAQARRRLDGVVCVARQEDGIVGVSSVFPAEVALIGGRRFWIYRSLLREQERGYEPEMIRATFESLDAEHRDEPGAPIGLCLLLSDPQRRGLRPEAEWSNPRMIYAGYLRDGRQARIAYFTAEVSGSPMPAGDRRWALEPGYRIDAFDEQDEVSAEDVVSLWTHEAGMPLEEAERRVQELLLVATDAERRPAGICTAYLRRNEQLSADLWHFRAFVAPAHRKSNVAVSLVVMGRERLEQRYVGGADRRGIGVLMEIENEGLKRYFPKGVWQPSDYLLIGENARSDHVRVHYFPGATAPEPDEA